MNENQSIAHYNILHPLGKGGMGEVYLAHDTKLDRQVDFPDAVRQDTERLARFRREARAAASLKHNNIATIYALEEVDDVLFIVMEYVDGDTLSDMIPVDGLDIGGTDGGKGVSQYAPTFFDVFIPLAHALAHAHEQGRVHRDLKPGNIMIAKDGTAKILDFGLATIHAAQSLQPINPNDVDTQTETKTLKAEELNIPVKPPTDPSAMSPGPKLMGTPAYMSPEQAESQPLDHRTDIFSFGVVMYEAITGKKPFEGSSRMSLLGRIVNEDPEPVTAIKPVTPYQLWQVIRQSLRKRREDRTQTARELYTNLREVQQDVQAGMVLVDATTIPEPESAPEPASEPSFYSAFRIPHSAFLFVAVALIIGMAAAWLLKPIPPIPEPPLRKFQWAIEGLGGSNISPDGTMIAYTKGSSPNQTLWLRDLNQTTPREIPDTEGASGLFWSPESDFVGYWTGTPNEGRSLWKVSARGGAGIPICSMPPGIGGGGGAWGSNGRIVFNSNVDLHEVSAQGGEPRMFLSPDSTRWEMSFFGPRFLSDGRTLLFTVQLTGDSTAVEQVAQRYPDSDGFSSFLRRRSIVSYAIGVLADNTGRRILDLSGDFVIGAVYSPTGHILYRQWPPDRSNNLWAAAFDSETLRVTGEPLLVAAGSRGVSVSFDGTLAYGSAPPGSGSVLRQLVWINRNGQVAGTIGPTHEGLNDPVLSSDEKRIAVWGGEVSSADIWIYEVERDTRSRLTNDSAQNVQPIWSPAGDSIVFVSDRNGGDFNLFITAADGSGEAGSFLTGPQGAAVGPHWSSDGRYLVFHSIGGSRDLGRFALHENRPPENLLVTRFEEALAQISPDGRYVAYQSDESGRWEIYVRRFPSGEGRWQVSTDGGAHAKWSGRGDELFYVTENALMATPVTTSPDFQPGIPQPLFTAEQIGASFGADGFWRQYDVTADGQRFVVVRDVQQDEAATPTITVVENWAREFDGRE